MKAQIEIIIRNQQGQVIGRLAPQTIDLRCQSVDEIEGAVEQWRVAPPIPSQKLILSHFLASGLAIFAIVCTGLVSYEIYSKRLQETMVASKNNHQTLNAKQFLQNSITTPLSSATSTSVLVKSDTDKPSLSAPTLNPSKPHLVPKTGKYYSTDPLLSISRREIDRAGNQVCIKIIDSVTTSAPDESSQVIVSSLSQRQDGIYIDATGEKLRLDPRYMNITDNKGVWQRLEAKANSSPFMTDCLQSQKRYVNRTRDEL